MNAAKKIAPRKKTNPALLTIIKKAEEDYRNTEEMFALLGWNRLPAELKVAIEDDVKAYCNELHGQYSTNCSYVQRRRESVDFWIKSYLDGICSLDTALDSLQVRQL